MVTLSSILITITVATCYYIYNHFMFSFFDILACESTSIKLRSLIALLNYAIFILLARTNQYLFINWTIIALALVAEMMVIYHIRRLMAATLGIQGALLGLVCNSIMRSFSAITSGYPLDAFDTVGANSQNNFSAYPIAMGFALTGLIFYILRQKFKGWFPADKKYSNLNIGFLFTMNLLFFLYQDLNLLIYFTEGKEIIIKLWCLKSAACVLLGSYICYSHILVFSKYHSYEKKAQNVRMELSSHHILTEKLESVAYYDALTNCKNRAAAKKELDELYKSNIPFTLCYIDLNNLKKVNDRFGHESGDRYLVTAGYVFKDIMSKDTTIYRYGGDEFLVIDRRGNNDVLRGELDEISSVLEEHSFSSGHPYLLSISFGIATSTEAETPDKLIHIADTRMYAHKHKEENL